MTTHNIARIHPVAELFPMLDGDDLADLAESIKRTGLLTPITRDPNGVLLDGRNRLRACEMAGVEPRFEIYSGDPIAFILATNIARRHLTAGQCAVIVALACPEPEKGGRGRRRNVSISKKFSASRLSEARTIIRHSRELALEVIAGACTFQQALWDATPPRQITPSAPPFYDTSRPDPPPQTVTVTVREPAPPAIRESHLAPGRTAENPVEQWLADWGPETLASRVIAADRLQPGYAQQVIDAVIEKMGGPSGTRH